LFPISEVNQLPILSQSRENPNSPRPACSQWMRSGYNMKRPTSTDGSQEQAPAYIEVRESVWKRTRIIVLWIGVCDKLFSLSRTPTMHMAAWILMLTGFAVMLLFRHAIPGMVRQMLKLNSAGMEWRQGSESRSGMWKNVKYLDVMKSTAGRIHRVTVRLENNETIVLRPFWASKDADFIGLLVGRYRAATKVTLPIITQKPSEAAYRKEEGQGAFTVLIFMLLPILLVVILLVERHR